MQRAGETYRCRDTYFNNHRNHTNTQSETKIYDQKTFTFTVRKKKRRKENAQAMH